MKSSHSSDLPAPKWQVTAALTLSSMVLSTLSPLMSEPAHPEWWADGVITEKEANNKAVVNVGQVKNLANKAQAELEKTVVDGAGYTKPYEAEDSPDAAWYETQKSPANLGQVKAAAKPFYNRLNEISPSWVESQFQINGLNTLGVDYFQDADTGYFYPWNPATPVLQNYKPAAVGQLKSAFAMRVRQDSDADGIRDLFEYRIIDADANDSITSLADVLPDRDFDNDGISNIDESNGVTTVEGSPTDTDSFSATPSPIEVSLFSGETRTETLSLNNSSGQEIDYTLTLSDNTAGSTGEYEFTDSLTGTAIYNWQDISATGIPAFLVDEGGFFFDGDEGTQEIILSNFSFSFYGIEYNTLFISANGYITVGSKHSSRNNVRIPSEAAPNGFIAPFWFDQDVNFQGEIYYQEEPDRLIVQYENVAPPVFSLDDDVFGGPPRGATYQVVLHDSGLIEFFYKEINNEPNAYTVGIENPDGLGGVEVFYREDSPEFFESYIENELAVKISFTEGQFVSVIENTGSVNANQEVEIDVLLDTTNLPSGAHTANIRIDHSDSSVPALDIPVIVTVIEDTDGDRLDDAWERYHFGGLDETALGDNDNDGVSNIDEYNNGTPPSVDNFPDTDGDLQGDWQEIAQGTDPNDSKSFAPRIELAVQKGSSVILPNDFAGLPEGVNAEFRLTGNEVADVGVTYSWKDSTQEGGPTYDWDAYDIRGTGERLADFDASAQRTVFRDLGFQMPFYGINYQSIGINGFGFMTFVEGQSNFPVADEFRRAIPNPNLQKPLIAAYLQFLAPNEHGNIYFQTFPTEGYAVIQYDEVPVSGSDSYLSFLVVVHEDGRVEHHYQNVMNNFGGYLIALQNETGTAATNVSWSNGSQQGNNIRVRSPIALEYNIEAPQDNYWLLEENVVLDTVQTYWELNLNTDLLVEGEAYQSQVALVDSSTGEIIYYRDIDVVITPSSTPDDDVVNGTIGNDRNLLGSGGNDVLSGGLGDDEIFGGSGEDRYLVEVNQGHDYISDINEVGTLDSFNALVFGPGIEPSNLLLDQRFDAVTVGYIDPVSGSYTWSVTIDGWSNRFSEITDRFVHDVWKFEFEDGTVWDSTNVLDGFSTYYNGEINNQIGTPAGNNINGTDEDDELFGRGGDDTLVGRNGDDVLNGGLGDDTLYGDFGDDVLIGGRDNDMLSGSSGNDVYLWGWGDGVDFITDIFGSNVIRLSDGISLEHVRFERGSVDSSNYITDWVTNDAGSDLRLIFTHPSDNLLSGSAVIEQLFTFRDRWAIEFADGDVLPARLLATSGRDALTGSEIDDVISGGLGDDFLYGELGNDRLEGEEGEDNLDGGEGDDDLRGGEGDDRLQGGTGNDELSGGSGSDVYVWSWGDGNDLIGFDQGGDNVLLLGEDLNPDNVEYTLSARGGFLDLTIRFTHSADEALSGSVIISGWSSVFGTGSRDLWVIEFADGLLRRGEFLGTSSSDTLNGDDEDNIIYGGLGADRLVGNDGADSLLGEGGDDQLEGGAGDDQLEGGIGNDTLIGGNGVDELLGGGDNDSLFGGGGEDLLYGGLGDDLISGGSGADRYFFNLGDGNDTYTEEDSATSLVVFGVGLDLESLVFVRSNEDLILSFNNNDTDSVTLKNALVDGTANWSLQFEGGERFVIANDTVDLGVTEFDDIIIGDNFNETINALGGNDEVSGSGGSDTINGGAGSNILSGGTGSDTFIIDVRAETDYITYDVSEKLNRDIDRIELRSPSIHDALLLIHDQEMNELLLLDKGNIFTPVVVIEGWDASLVDSLLPIQEITFSSGEFWDIEEIKSRIQNGQDDINGDGISTLDNIALGIDPFNTDHDGDGLTNLQERLLGTALFSTDTDGDGVSDGLDADPSDPFVTTFSGLPPAGDLEIIIDFPTNAILVD